MSRLLHLSTALLALWFLAVSCAQPQSTPTSTTLPPPSPTFSLSPTPPPTATTIPTPTPTATRIPTPTQRATTPSTLAPLFGLVLERTADIRGLEALEEVIPRFMTREDLATSLREDLEEDREEVLKTQALLKVLGLIPQDADLYQMLLDLYGEQVVGFYDTETQELYLIKGVEEITPLEEISLAHEYVHALQQQHFDIHALSEGVKEDSEASAALDALIEGDAVAVQFRYMLTHLTSRQLREVLDASGESAVFDASPYFLQQSLLFPYTAGQDFVDTLLLSGQWDAINSAYSNPPLSTEQVLHPEKYLQGERPVAVLLPDVATALGEGWREVYSDVMGEFSLKTYLETRTNRDVAARAAAGWGGDGFTLLEGPKGEKALAVLLHWDTPGDAREFFNALESSSSVPKEGYLGIKENRVLWIISPSKELTERIRARFPDL